MNWLAAGAAALALPFVLVVAAATQNSQTSVLLVDVTLEDGPRIVAPVPYALVRAGLALAPRDVRQLDLPNLADYAHDLGEILHALRDAPDGVYVEIHTPDEHVVVSKREGALRVAAVDGDRTRVELTLPVEALLSVHAAYEPETGVLSTGDLVNALRGAPRGSLLHLVDGETEVRLRAW